MITKDILRREINSWLTMSPIIHKEQWLAAPGYESQEDSDDLPTLPSVLKTPGNGALLETVLDKNGKLMSTKRSRMPFCRRLKALAQRKRESMSTLNGLERENENCRHSDHKWVLECHGFTLKSFGQNSLTDTNILPQKIVDTAEIDKNSQ